MSENVRREAEKNDATTEKNTKTRQRTINRGDNQKAKSTSDTPQKERVPCVESGFLHHCALEKCPRTK
ncbi:hypothetical protein BCR44DRAFT_319812 [Catenaria anguillulae PL171]|uniref:Uncharacterized protein n=1 Tax=Catenaria anguillulae PL171 TaxID=765915 RepID=A0A1Y2HRW3_9FUNG|nr:hypothetical protein BCR44DRAFT_319812 [Catenaria anguillulae PL171]